MVEIRRWRHRVGFDRLRSRAEPAVRRDRERLDLELRREGWLVVEQDILPDPGNPEQPAIDQRHNREYLRERGI